MNQWYAKKRHVFVLLTLVGAILMGLVWLVSVPGSASAQGTLLLNTSYKDATPRKVGAGGTVAYSIVLNNDTLSTTSSIVVVDPLEPRLSYVPGSAAVIGGGGLAGYSGGRVQFSVDPIAAGNTVTLSFQAIVATTVSPDDVITNTATITEAGVSFTRSVSITVTDAPVVQIRQPISGTLFTASPGTNVVISGYAWDSGNDPGFPATPVIASISDPSSGAYFVSWTDGADALAYHLQESTSPYFNKNLVDYNPTTNLTNQYVTGKTPGTYYYRLRAINLVGSSRWSDIRSVVVTTAMMGQSLSQDFELSALWTASAAVPAVYVRINGGTWQATAVTQNADGYWDWSYTWPLPQEDDAIYTIEARSQDVGGNYGEIDMIRVTIRNGTRYVYLPMVMRRYPPLPYAPTLNINSNDGYGTYQLGWVYVPDTDLYKPTSYTFQEATNANFTNPIEESFPSTTLSRSYANKAVGTYYYRVRGHNAYGTGGWSNVQTIVVSSRGFTDDFSNPATGWPRQVFSIDGRGVLDANYDNGYYRMKILWNQYGLNNKRMGLLPAPYKHYDRTYDVEVLHRFVKAVDEGGYSPAQGKAGLVFLATRTDGGTGYLQTFHTVEWNFEGRCAISGYTNYPTDGGHNPYVPVAYLGRGTNDEFVYRNWGGWNDPPCPGLKAGYDKDVTVRVEVRNTQFNVFFNGTYIGSYTFKSGLPGEPYVGLITGSWDITPVQSRFDNFRVTDK
ncbi:MAG: DUF11 domain-containing protein [Anaerolineae bacterium]|nr:DUF11 domain-containing protein [Anaerolineae bacterium]